MNVFDSETSTDLVVFYCFWRLCVLVSCSLSADSLIDSILLGGILYSYTFLRSVVCLSSVTFVPPS